MACWPDRAERCFALRSMLDAGVELAMGSDAPVAALDPWLTLAAAVHRTGDDREPWHPEQSITPAEALASSTDGQGTPGVGSRADLVLLDDDPLATDLPADDTAAVGARLRQMRVAATFVGGRATHSGL
ncbi:MAG TPA: amidohydrolase family protein, partial [Marmoricola sp.]|nr:amidohydrolase family protein [Marmoricola sp.]